MFGADARRVPAWWADALVAIANARGDYERAEYEALKKKQTRNSR